MHYSKIYEQGAIFQALTDIGGRLAIVTIEGNRDFLRYVKGSECFHPDPVNDNRGVSQEKQDGIQSPSINSTISPFLRALNRPPHHIAWERARELEFLHSQKTTQIFVFVGACYKHAKIKHTRIVTLYTQGSPFDNQHILE